MVPFSLEIPRTIHFGSGELSRLATALDASGPRVLVVTGRHSQSDTILQSELGSALRDRVVERLVCPNGEPTVTSLADAMNAAQTFHPDLILAIGGGSVLDTAKALSVLTRYPGPVERFLEGVAGSGPVPAPGVPWIAVPTTAGTGAEVTKNAVVKISESGVKRSMRSAHMLAYAVIVDPRLTLTLPQGVTGTSGLDALTQLVESYVSRGSTPPVMSLVEGAFPLMLEALDGLSVSPHDLGLREKASYGATISGIALANAGLGAAHGFAAALGGSFAVPHGLACAVMLPYVLEANAPVIADRIDKLMGKNGVARLGDTVRRLLCDYHLPADLRSYRIPPESLADLADKSSGSSMRGNPRTIELAERREILARVI